MYSSVIVASTSVTMPVIQSIQGKGGSGIELEFPAIALHILQDCGVTFDTGSNVFNIQSLFLDICHILFLLSCLLLYLPDLFLCILLSLCTRPQSN